MYAGDFEAAAGQARALIEDSPEYGTAYLPLAISLLAMGDSDGARAAYQRMRAATTSEHRESVALLGLADISIYLGEFDQAEQTLLQGIEEDVNDGVSLAAATKQIALAEAFAAGATHARRHDLPPGERPRWAARRRDRRGPIRHRHLRTQ